MLGTSFSADHARSLDLDPVECLTALLDMGLQTIRLAAYWNQIQPSEDIFDFSDLKWQLDVCEARGISVVLVVGMKAPRWPEFYIPEWAKNLSDSDFESALFSYLQRTVQWAQKWSCLEYWQVENEPLDPSGPEWRRVPLSLLQKEVALVRECDLQNRPIVLTAWGNEMLSRGTLAPLSELGDVVGIDVYPRVFIRRVSGRNIYASFWWQRFTISLPCGRCRSQSGFRSYKLNLGKKVPKGIAPPARRVSILSSLSGTGSGQNYFQFLESFYGVASTGSGELDRMILDILI